MSYPLPGRRLSICFVTTILLLVINVVTVFQNITKFSRRTHSITIMDSSVFKERATSNYSKFQFSSKSQQLQINGISPPAKTNKFVYNERSDSNAFLLKNNQSKLPVRVAFFEGFRGDNWIFDRYFKPFTSEVRCACSQDRDDVVIKQMVSKRYEIKSFDIVVFPYDVTVLRGDKLFWARLHEIREQERPHQKWIYATRESPFKLRRTIIPRPFTKKSFHWSLTYRTISDFPSPYGYYQLYETQPNRTRTKNWAMGKSGLIAWMSSNNHTSWYRQNFVGRLNDLTKIDIYGKNGVQCGRSSEECESKIKTYKFYLALENSCCKEYISEKFWRTLTWNCVPIVVGPSKEDYKRMAPPHSFIHADDYDSMEDLVDFVHKVDANDTLYNTFFQWKDTGYVVNSFPDAGSDTKNVPDEPPDQLFYSCAKVCAMAKKYRLEKNKASLDESLSYFDPGSHGWDGSCHDCGTKSWIKKFQKDN
ncbi:Glycoprotein 3-alpha-L-fucosyltransferase A [Holothuria leucospilota]|uniref:Fucosyltransferase n=1 Tax=Holothuria leucospilota TaxID=206669 RepID=A0A9Q0YBW2_HOLLE|nr:Glycoprotein 3-alpha-L-fucosyltransferase A [Holothuria leucospilota]